MNSSEMRTIISLLNENHLVEANGDENVEIVKLTVTDADNELWAKVDSAKTLYDFIDFIDMFFEVRYDGKPAETNPELEGYPTINEEVLSQMKDMDSEQQPDFNDYMKEYVVGWDNTSEF